MQSQQLDYRPVWGSVSSTLAEQIEQYWQSNQITIAEPLRAQRAQQVAVVIYGEQQQLLGLCTAAGCYATRFQANFYYIRVSLAKSIRFTYALPELFCQTYELFNRSYDPRQKQAPIGLYAHFENAYLNRLRSAVIEEAGLVFVGYNERGEQERVRYFTGAKIGRYTPQQSAKGER